ncbi:MAG TPA: Dabb family protein [Amycolatopsis sp.]
MLEHYVVFKPHPQRADELADALATFASGMAGTLPCLLELSWGANTNTSGLRHGYTHGCFARLTSQRSLTEEYWIHPAHQRLLAQLDDICEDRFALDYVTGDVISGGAQR